MGAGARHLRAGRLRGHRRGAGVSADDLDITLEDGLLTIQGERHVNSESSEQYHRVERRYGSFRRSITLPSQVQADAIEASFENGVLGVRVVPKAEEAKPKKITVRAGGGRQQVPGTSTPAGDALAGPCRQGGGGPPPPLPEEHREEHRCPAGG